VKEEYIEKSKGHYSYRKAIQLAVTLFNLSFNVFTQFAGRQERVLLKQFPKITILDQQKLELFRKNKTKTKQKPKVELY